MEVSVVEIKDVKTPEQVQRVAAREVEAERERRTKTINARSESQAFKELRQAANTLSKSPISPQPHYPQTLLEFGAGQNFMVVFPLPMDIIGLFLERFGPQGGLLEANEGKDGEGAGTSRHR